MLRLFAALDLPIEIAEGLMQRQRGLPGAAWRPEEALHITLRFFGEVQPTLAADLDSALAAVSMASFELGLEGTGAFADPSASGDRMRAVWAGVGASEPLQRLAAKCDTAARKVGLTPETRAFRPHVTLAYLRGVLPEKAGAWVAENHLLKSPVWRVGHFSLYSSWLSPSGSRYDLERRYPLT